MIESKLTLFDKQVEVLFGDAVVFLQDALCLIPEVFDAIDVVESTLGKMGGNHTMIAKTYDALRFYHERSPMLCAA